MVINITIVG